MAATSFSRSSIDDEISARSDLILDESSEEEEASRSSAIRDSIDRLESANWERNEEVDSNVEDEEEEKAESDLRAWWRAEKRSSMSWCFFCSASSTVSDLGSSSSISCDGVFKLKFTGQAFNVIVDFIPPGYL